jgi:hypothetical protein
MDFWNDDNMFVTKIKQKMWTQKVCYNNVKLKIEKNHHQMRNLRIKCIKNFPIEENLIYFWNKKIINLLSISHWNIQISTWFFGPITCLVISKRWFTNYFDKKRENYKIYILIIIIIAWILVGSKCQNWIT